MLIFLCILKWYLVGSLMAVATGYSLISIESLDLKEFDMSLFRFMLYVFFLSWVIVGIFIYGILKGMGSEITK